jgi:hypothetical protein
MDQHRRTHRQSIRHALSRLCACCLLAAAMGAAAGVQAEDFVINVPVELEAMEPEVHIVQVSCYVHAIGSGDGARLGEGEASMPMPESGDFNGVVRVPIVLLPGRERRDAHAYVCSLMFPGGATMEAERDLGRPAAQPSPGTMPVLQIRGLLPR